ncbi:unnamed protein product, partial [Symbiodinium necroappetens]
DQTDGDMEVDNPQPEDEEDVEEPTTRKEFQAWRSKFRNNVHVSATLYQDRRLQSRIRMLALCSKPVSQEYFNTLEKQQAAQLEWAANRSSGSWFVTVHKTLNLIHSASFLQELPVSSWNGSRSVGADEAWVQQESALLNEAWRLLVELASARTVPFHFCFTCLSVYGIDIRSSVAVDDSDHASNVYTPPAANISARLRPMLLLHRIWSQAMFSYVPPHMLASVFGKPADRNWSLDLFRNLDKGLRVAVRLVKDSPDSTVGAEVRALLKDVWWHETPLCLELIQIARDSGFTATDRELRTACFGMFGGPSNTKYTAEDVFAHLTDITSRSQKGCMRMAKPSLQQSKLQAFLGQNPASDYMEYKADRSDRSGLYFGASVPPPDKLELSSLLQ